MVQKVTRPESRPRGRPRSFDTDEVLDRARAVFWNLGYAATSLDDIAAATGLNRPSLYAAFGDKHALYLAALERSRAEATAALGAALQAEAPLRQLLGIIFDRTVDIYRRGEAGQRGCFLIGTAVTQAVDDPKARELLASYIAGTDALFRERFERDAGQLTPGIAPQAAAAMASGTFHTLAVRARTGASEADLKAVGRASVDLICGPIPS
jgi:TetR/AcrR family transcriptional regulator, copper-responsive repressor